MPRALPKYEITFAAKGRKGPTLIPAPLDPDTQIRRAIRRAAKALRAAEPLTQVTVRGWQPGDTSKRGRVEYQAHLDKDGKIHEGGALTCPDCKRGVLSRNKKPDALKRIVERCDSCNHRRVVDGPDVSTPLSQSIVRAANGGAPTNVTHAAPVAVVGEPCPCCHRKVLQLPICAKCKKNRRVLGKSRCEECSRPAALKSRFCVKCGEQFTPVRGEKLTGTAAYHCPTHRPKKKPAKAARLAGAA